MRRSPSAAAALALCTFVSPASAAWPREAVAGNFDVVLAEQDPTSGVARYASPHFWITSDLRLPLGVVRDLAAVFEATRVAVRTSPLGFDHSSEPPRYPVRLCGTVESYAAVGGPLGSGGRFNGREMLVLLPNIGIRPTTSGLGAEHQQHLFVLKHEVTHQLVAPSRLRLPIWLNEGLAECFAAAPYVRGRYSFSGLDSAMRDYLLKWRRTSAARSKLQFIAPARVLSMNPRDWDQQVAAGQAYDLYNSAGLLTHWFLHHDGAGDSANLMSYLEALRARMPDDYRFAALQAEPRSPARADAGRAGSE